MTTTRLPVAERRAQLVDAALSVASADGIAAATVRRVAEEAGVALGVVHYAFDDKDELFVELAARIVADLTAAGSAALEFDERPDLASALRCAVNALWDSVESSEGEQLLTYEITAHALRNAELRGVAVRQYQVSQSAAEALLELAAEASGATWTRPLPDVAADALAFVDGVTLRWLVDRDGAAARARLEWFAGYLATFAKRGRRGRRAS